MVEQKLPLEQSRSLAQFDRHAPVELLQAYGVQSVVVPVTQVPEPLQLDCACDDDGLVQNAGAHCVVGPYSAQLPVPLHCPV